MSNGEQHTNQATTWTVTKDSWLTPETYNQAITARHHGEQSYLSIINAHILANTILITAISMLIAVKNPGFAGKFIITFIALLGVFIARQTRLAFLIARGNNICWERVIREYEQQRPIFTPPTRGGLYTLNRCVMTNGRTCQRSPVSVNFEKEEDIEKAIIARDKLSAKRMKLYPMIFRCVYFLLIAFTWRDLFKTILQ